MTQDLLFRHDAYLREAPAIVLGHTPEGGVLVDAPLFYATGGGQPGDSGWLVWPGGRLDVATAVKTAQGAVALVPAAPQPLPPPGTGVMQHLDWERRHRHMRVHTALHLLSVVVPLPVTGGQIGADRGRLDFDMSEPPADPAALTDALNRLIQRDLPVQDLWITEAELAARPDLVKTMKVRPPAGQGRDLGRVRLVRIGDATAPVDLQPCGGTHVARTAEIGPVEIGRIENKGRQNRRITLLLAD